MISVSTLITIQALVAVCLVLVVLLQFGKGAETGLLGASDSVMSGPQKGNFFSKLTIVLSIIFFANSIYLARLQGRHPAPSKLDGKVPNVRPFSRQEEKEEEEQGEEKELPPKKAN